MQDLVPHHTGRINTEVILMPSDEEITETEELGSCKTIGKNTQ
jgi:hypothetical protein